MFTVYNFEPFYESEIPSHNMLSLSYTDISKQEPSLSHSHPYTEIMLVVEGSGYIAVNQKKIPFQKGILYFVNPNVEHSESSSSTLKYYVLKVSHFTVFKKEAYSDIIEFPLDYSTQANLLNRFSQLLTNCAHKDTEYQKKLISLDLTYLYYYFLQILGKTYHVNQSKVTQYSPRIQTIINYISANYALDLKIADIAKQFYISHNNLIYRFKKELGISPNEFIIQQRIHASKGLLKNTDYTVIQIATLCGFSSSSFFGKVFRNHVGISPSEYRAQSKRK